MLDTDICRHFLNNTLHKEFMLPHLHHLVLCDRRPILYQQVDSMVCHQLNHIVSNHSRIHKHNKIPGRDWVDGSEVMKAEEFVTTCP